MQGLDRKQRREFDDELYGFTSMNRAGNDALRDARVADETMNDPTGGTR